MPRRFHAANLAGMADSSAAGDLAEWADLELPPNLILGGPPGTGKTWAAAAVLRRRYGRGERFAWWATAALLDAVRPGADPDRSTWNGALTVPLLLLDDLAAQRDTEWTDERLDLLVDTRWAEQRPIIVTTNLTRAQAQDRLPGRLYSRLYGGATVITIAGPDRRMTP